MRFGSNATSRRAMSRSANAGRRGVRTSEPEWTRFPIARLSYTKKTGLWTLYWRDRNLKFHRYQFLAPSPHVQDLLDHIENGGDPIFWG